MGNCGSSLNCTSQDSSITVDPDISGIGVLASFIATACLTFIAIVVGYLLDSVPDDVLTDLDRACLARVSWRWPSWRWSKKTVKSTQERSLENGPRDKAARTQRSQILERFILTLSDQQLVTGLSILIVGFKGLCTISFYNMNIVTAIAWFSSTTHLSTLAILRSYLIDHPRLRNWRAGAMLCVFALLVVAQLAIAGPADWSVPAQCLFRSWTYWETVRSLGIPFAGTVIVVLFLIASYSSRIARLYSFDPEWTLGMWLARAVFFKEKQMVAVEQAAITANARSRSERGAAFRENRFQRRVARYMKKQNGETSGFMYRLREIMFINQEIQHSFIGELQALLFGFSFGMTQLWIFRNLLNFTHIPGTDYLVGDDNTFGFGQLVPLFLLLLPIFGAFEAYEETGNISTSNVIAVEPASRLQPPNFWLHSYSSIDNRQSCLDLCSPTNSIPLENMNHEPPQQERHTDVENIPQAPRIPAPTACICRTPKTNSHLWVTISVIIAVRTTLMALYGVTFAGAFNLIDDNVGIGALALGAFFCGGMMVLEFFYLVGYSRDL